MNQNQTRDSTHETDWVHDMWQRVLHKVEHTSQRIGDSFPHISHNGQYEHERVSWWTNGFWPGLLWLLYEDTGNDTFRELAVSCEEKLDDHMHCFTHIDHDAGFIWGLSAVANYKLTGNEQSRLRGLIAASHLAARFNVRGQFIRAWNGADKSGWCIIDCLMNLCLLYWASEETGDPRFRHIAMAHADNTLEHFVRSDGSVHHIVCFDPETGEREKALGGQGYSPESAWARGTSWAVYGFSLSYRYTGEKRYLDAAKKIAHFFLANLPDDQLPYWDFRAPVTEHMAYDSSAAVCTASGLIEISRQVDPLEADVYLRAAKRLVRNMLDKHCDWSLEEEGILLKGTVHVPENKGINVPIIYGDYFLIEALAKLRGKKDLFW